MDNPADFRRTSGELLARQIQEEGGDMGKGRDLGTMEIPAQEEYCFQIIGHRTFMREATTTDFSPSASRFVRRFVRTILLDI